MKYCRFELSNQPHYGLVEAVAGVETVTRLFLTAPQDADGPHRQETTATESSASESVESGSGAKARRAARSSSSTGSSSK